MENEIRNVDHNLKVIIQQIVELIQGSNAYFEKSITLCMHSIVKSDRSWEYSELLDNDIYQYSISTLERSYQKTGKRISGCNTIMYNESLLLWILDLCQIAGQWEIKFYRDWISDDSFILRCYLVFGSQELWSLEQVQNAAFYVQGAWQFPSSFLGIEHIWIWIWKIRIFLSLHFPTQGFWGFWQSTVCSNISYFQFYMQSEY